MIYHSHNNTVNLLLANLSWRRTIQRCSIADQARRPVIISVVREFPTSRVIIDHADARTALLEFASYTNTTGSLLLLTGLNGILLLNPNKYWSCKSRGISVDLRFVDSRREGRSRRRRPHLLLSKHKPHRPGTGLFWSTAKTQCRDDASCLKGCPAWGITCPFMRVPGSSL